MSKACSSCGTDLRDGARLCFTCGAPVPGVDGSSRASTVSSSVAQPAVAEGSVGMTRAALSPTCPVCGAAVVSGTRRCPNCGLALTSIGGVPPSRPLASSFGPANARFGERPIMVEPFVPRRPGPEQWPWMTIGLVVVGLVLFFGVLAAVLLLLDGSITDPERSASAPEPIAADVAANGVIALRGPTTTPTPPSIESTSTVEPSVVVVVQDDTAAGSDNHACADAFGPAAAALVAGAEQSVNLRDGPDRSAPVLDQVPVGTELTYFPESARQGEQWWWVGVAAQGRCGWMAAQFLHDGQGQPVDPVGQAPWAG